jgi:hypothetical protein
MHQNSLMKNTKSYDYDPIVKGPIISEKSKAVQTLKYQNTFSSPKIL